MNYKILESKIFDLNNNEVLPNEKNIVELVIDGKKRRFVADIFIKNFVANKTIDKPKKKRKSRHEKKEKKENLIVIKKPKSWHRRRAINSIDENGVKVEFESIADAGRKLNISAGYISNILIGRKPKNLIKGYNFEYLIQ